MEAFKSNKTRSSRNSTRYFAHVSDQLEGRSPRRRTRSPPRPPRSTRCFASPAIPALQCGTPRRLPQPAGQRASPVSTAGRVARARHPWPADRVHAAGGRRAPRSLARRTGRRTGTGRSKRPTLSSTGRPLRGRSSPAPCSISPQRHSWPIWDTYPAAAGAAAAGAGDRCHRGGARRPASRADSGWHPPGTGPTGLASGRGSRLRAPAAGGRFWMDSARKANGVSTGVTGAARPKRRRAGPMPRWPFASGAAAGRMPKAMEQLSEFREWRACPLARIGLFFRRWAFAPGSACPCGRRANGPASSASRRCAAAAAGARTTLPCLARPGSFAEGARMRAGAGAEGGIGG